MSLTTVTQVTQVTQIAHVTHVTHLAQVLQTIHQLSLSSVPLLWNHPCHMGVRQREVSGFWEEVSGFQEEVSGFEKEVSGFQEEVSGFQGRFCVLGSDGLNMNGPREAVSNWEVAFWVLTPYLLLTPYLFHYPNNQFRAAGIVEKTPRL